MAIPAPMVPAPTTAAARIWRISACAGRQAIFAAVRSARNACLMAPEAGLSNSIMNASRSNARPASTGKAAAARRQAIHAFTAGGHCPLLPARCSSSCENSGDSGASTARSRSKDAFMPSRTIRCASPRQASSRFCSTTRSNKPARLGASALTGSPLQIILAAASRPIARGRRCVPPAPGIRPSLISGRATRLPAIATR
ncbi:hypothetical protein D3C72_1377100 [compost metagenome]